MPTALAIVGGLQWVASGGASVSVFFSTRLITSTATYYHNLAIDLALTEAETEAAMHQLRAAAIPLAMAREGMIPADHDQIAKYAAPLEDYFREAGREADIPRLPELLQAEATAVLAEHAEWRAARDAPPASEA